MSVNYVELENKVDKLFGDIDFDAECEKTIDVVSIASKLGFKVANAILDDDADGFVVVDKNARSILNINTTKLIVVNNERSIEWKRFIVAHELAHYVLHYDNDNDQGIYAHRDHRVGKNKYENDADYFAAALLMPRKVFRRRYQELKDNNVTGDYATILAEKLEVTYIMASRRIQELSLNE